MKYYLTQIRTSGTQQEFNAVDVNDWLQVVYNGSPFNPDIPVANISNAHTKGYFSTITRCIDEALLIPRDMAKSIRLAETYLSRIESIIDTFNRQYDIQSGDYSRCYTTFSIPKASGGYRTISAPNEALKVAHTEIAQILYYKFNLLYHDCCFSYFPHRCAKDALLVHQNFDSHWFLKADLKDFFPNTTKEFIINQLNKLLPIAEMGIVRGTLLDRVLEKLVDFCLLNGGLPQGAPLSPMITNLIMIPIDYELHKKFKSMRMRYTRYADDILVSSRVKATPTSITNIIQEVLTNQNAPYIINSDKTRYGSRAGANWNLGLMLNKDNNITVGHKRKQQIKAGVYNMLRDFSNGIRWDYEQTTALLGSIAYMRSVESGYTDYMIRRIESQLHTDFHSTVKQLLNNRV